MVEFKPMKLSFFLILVFRSTATKPHSVVVRDGDKVLLSCKTVIDQVTCTQVTWSFSRFTRSAAEALVKLGTIVRPQTSGDDVGRMALAANCSLMIQRVSDKDVGRYFCQGFNYSKPNQVDLSVVKITEHKRAEKVTLKCSVSTYKQDKLELKWLLNGVEINKLDSKELETQKSHNSANVTFLMTHFIYQPDYKSLKCEVGDAEQQFAFRSQTSGKEDENIEASPEASVLSEVEKLKKGGLFPLSWGLWWLYVMVVVGVAAVSAAAVLVRRRKNKGKKTQMNEAMGKNSSMIPETNLNIQHPEVSISYASIVHTGETNQQVRRSHTAVTYSTVKAAPSTDPSNLYDTIN